MKMTRLDQNASRLSMRNSILVWVAGIVIGWGCAVVLFYQLIRDSAEEGRPGVQMVAEAQDAVGVADIEPAAGGTSESARRIDQTQQQPNAAAQAPLPAIAEGS